MKPEHEDIGEKLTGSAQKLDGANVPAPAFQYFKDLVDREQARARRSQRRQLALFVAVALALVAGLLFCMGSYQVVFIALQGAAALGAAAGLAWFFLRKPQEGVGQ